MEHAHIIGTTGAGKTKFLEHCIRQDIIAGRGVCVIDPHGNHPESLYRSLLNWLEERGYTKSRVVHVIDPNAASHVTGIDPLALPELGYDPAVIADAVLEAFERMWGEEDTDTKPTIQRILTSTFTALCELALTLAEARLLLDPQDRAGVRAWAIKTLRDEEAREELQYLHDIASEPRGRQEFRKEVLGPRNRLAKLTRVEAMRTMVGQQAATGRTIDFRAALDEGHIILANLSGGPRASDKSCQLLGRLLTRFVFFNAQRRKHPERPFFFYIDECHNFLSGDVERLLAEARKFGIGCVLAHQWQSQLAKQDVATLEAVQNATNLKAVFRLKDPKDAAHLAETVIPLDLEVPVQALIKPIVVGHRRTLFRSSGRAEHSARGAAVAESTTESETESASDTDMLGTGSASLTGAVSGQSSGIVMLADSGWLSMPEVITLSAGQSSSVSNARAQSKNATSGTSQSRASSWARSRTKIGSESQGTSRSEGATEGLEPIYADLPTAVHSKENALYFAAQTLRSLATGQAFINYVAADGMASAKLTVPKVDAPRLSDVDFAALRTRVLAASPSATEAGQAAQNVKDREKQLIAEAQAAQAPPDEPASFRVKAPKRKRTSRGAAK